MNTQLIAAEYSENFISDVILIAGTSFILGSLLTILLLMALDRRGKNGQRTLGNSTLLKIFRR